MSNLPKKAILFALLSVMSYNVTTCMDRQEDPFDDRNLIKSFIIGHQSNSLEQLLQMEKENLAVLMQEYEQIKKEYERVKGLQQQALQAPKEVEDFINEVLNYQNSKMAQYALNGFISEQNIRLNRRISPIDMVIWAMKAFLIEKKVKTKEELTELLKESQPEQTYTTLLEILFELPAQAKRLPELVNRQIRELERKLHRLKEKIEKSKKYIASNQKEKEEIEKIKEKRKKEDCPICMEEFGTQDTIRLGCTHKFHETCIKQWFESKNYDDARTCPMCRTKKQEAEKKKKEQMDSLPQFMKESQNEYEMLQQLKKQREEERKKEEEKKQRQEQIRGLSNAIGPNNPLDLDFQNLNRPQLPLLRVQPNQRRNNRQNQQLGGLSGSLSSLSNPNEEEEESLEEILRRIRNNQQRNNQQDQNDFLDL